MNPLWFLIPTVLAVTGVALAIHSLRLVYKLKNSPWREVTVYAPALPVEPGNQKVVSAKEPPRFNPTDRKYVCSHDDPLCDRYGCLDDPNWAGDRK